MDATKSKPNASMAAAIEHAASGMMQSTWKFFLPDSDKPPPPKLVGDDERIIDIIGEQIEFLHRSYEGRCWYWEVLETIRRLLLTAVVSIVDAGNPDQIIFGIFMSVCFMKLYAYFQPFADKKDDMLQELAQYQIFFTQFASLILRGQLLQGTLWMLGMDVILIVLNSVTPMVAIALIVEVRYSFADRAKIASTLDNARRSTVYRVRDSVLAVGGAVQNTTTWAAVEKKLFQWGVLRRDPSVLERYRETNRAALASVQTYNPRASLADDLGLVPVRMCVLICCCGDVVCA